MCQHPWPASPGSAWGEGGAQPRAWSDLAQYSDIGQIPQIQNGYLIGPNALMQMCHLDEDIVEWNSLFHHGRILNLRK